MQCTAQNIKLSDKAVTSSQSSRPPCSRTHAWRRHCLMVQPSMIFCLNNICHSSTRRVTRRWRHNGRCDTRNTQYVRSRCDSQSD